MKKITISFLEDKQIIQQIDDIASKRGSDRSAIIREFIREQIKRNNQEVTQHV